MSARTILHADMDAFYAAIEQRDDPRLRGRPVIVGWPGKRGVVSTASYEARVFGVRSAMPGTVARRLCPQGVWVVPRMAVYAAVSEAVRAVFDRHAPRVEPLSLDEAFLDVTGCELLSGDGVATARAIKAEVLRTTGLTVSVGVAACKYVAKVASDLRKPDGLVVVPPGTEAAFLAPLPVRALWGAGKVMQARLERFGLRTLGDLQRLELPALSALLGQTMGPHFWALARGLDEREVVPDRDPRSISHEQTFADDLTTRAACHKVLLELAEGVGRRLREAGLRGRTVRLQLRDPDVTTVTRQQHLETGTQDDLAIYRSAVALFDQVRRTMRPVRLLGVGVAELQSGAAPRQGELFAGDARRQDRLLDAVDRIRARFGKDAIHRGG